MKNLEKIAEDLFNKIRGRFPSVTIGDENGQVTNVPSDARYFDFEYKQSEKTLGKVSVSIDEDSLSVMYSDNFVANEDITTKNNWYDFLKELRQFSKKRMLNFDTRNITKSNLNRRDYKFLATNRPEEEQMTESTMYGTNKTSFQKIGNAKLSIKHSQAINTESSSARSQKIGKIYIESPDGERFKYPYKHLSGARAMARHVAEGGNPYDDFGKHITGLSEELSKLRKFKSYMGRSSVMAESLADYVSIVRERMETIKKDILKLQKESFYKEAFESFEAPVVEDVPEDVAENWIDQLTIKQFNEELQDVFPYIYKLVSEATRAKEIGPEDLEEGIIDWIKSKWEEYRQADRERMAQYDAQLELMTSILSSNGYDDYRIQRLTHGCLNDPRVCLYNEIRKNNMQVDAADQQTITDIGKELNSGWMTRSGTTDEDAPTPPRDAQPDAPTPQDNPNTSAPRGSLDNIDRPAETVKVRQGMTLFSIAQMFNDQNNMGGDVQQFVKDIMELNNISNPRQIQVGQVIQIPYSMGTGRDGASRGLPPGGFRSYESQIENAFEELMGQFSESDECDSSCPKSCPDCGGTGDPETFKKTQKETEMESEKPQTPLSEFILSYFDYTTGQFPKGETAILTMVEKDYGERYINPAKQFIEKINNKVAEVMGYKEEPELMDTLTPTDDEWSKTLQIPNRETWEKLIKQAKAKGDKEMLGKLMAMGYKEEPEVVVQDNSELDSIRSLAGL